MHHTPRIDVHGLNSSQDRLRETVAAVDHDVAALSRSESDAHAGEYQRLSTSWAELVDELALGPAPRLTPCPVCGHDCRIDATVCGFCWTKRAPTTAVGAH